jgi:hypothetical protein
MDKVPPMCRLDRGRDLAQDPERPLIVHSPFGAQRVAQCPALEQLHHEKGLRATDDAVVMYRHDIRMGEGSRGARLALKALGGSGTANKFLTNELRCDTPIERRVERKVHRAHPSTPQPALELIPSGQYAWGVHRHQQRTV